jgi:hypothetical protein
MLSVRHRERETALSLQAAPVETGRVSKLFFQRAGASAFRRQHPKPTISLRETLPQSAIDERNIRQNFRKVKAVSRETFRIRRNN